MRFTKCVFLAILITLGAHLATLSARAQGMASYYETADFLGAPPASFREGLLGYANPAIPALTDNHFLAAWSTDGRRALSLEDWGVFSSVGGLGAAVVRRRQGPLRVAGYHLSLAGGMENSAFGVGYQGYSGDATVLGRYNRLTFGSIVRANPYLSVGLVGNVSLETDDREVIAEIGVRPLGTPRLTVFADAAWPDGEALEDTPWSAGATVELISGLDLRGRVFDSEAFTLGLRLELGRVGLDSQSRVDPSGEYAQQVNRIRAGDYVRSRVAETVRRGTEHVEMPLEGRIRYQESWFSTLFERETPRFYEALRTIRQAGENDRISAVAVNLSGLQVSPEQGWELRTAVEEAQARDTKIVAFLESGSMTSYHLASAADVVVLDPEGTLVLPGYAASRTFVEGTLDKLGLGVQEWRFFEYKSAFERYSRSDFSPADSLQRKMHVDDQYELTTGDVTRDRPISDAEFDRAIDEQTVLTAREARRAGLVDTLARWHERSDLLEKAVGRKTKSLDVDVLDQIATATRTWGATPKIAIVYGLGTTEVEAGMQSRALSKQLRDLIDKDDVKAVVFRVDSPGGSPVAASQVGDAVKALAKEKPVVVSQGQVAGSGGYWVSAYADTIVAGPNTVTGSIGVIGGWIYDRGFSEKTGLTSDVVQRGERVDLFEGIRLPLVGLPVPTRRLSEDEMARVEEVIQAQYDRFVAVVAEGRDTTETHVREIGEGRIYSGVDGREVGLVDEIGGLPRAIDLARSAAGLGPDEGIVDEVNPISGTIDVGRFVPGPLARIFFGSHSEGTEAHDPFADYLRIVLETQPQPLVLLPPDLTPAGE